MLYEIKFDICWSWIVIIVQDGNILAEYDISKAVHLRCDVPLNSDFNLILNTAKKTVRL